MTNQDNEAAGSAEASHITTNSAQSDNDPLNSARTVKVIPTSPQSAFSRDSPCHHPRCARLKKCSTRPQLCQNGEASVCTTIQDTRKWTVKQESYATTAAAGVTFLPVDSQVQQHPGPAH